VRSGFVASLAWPGGNITGLTTQYPELAGKRLELLKEAIPTLSRLAVLWDPSLTGVRQVISETEVAAKALGMNLQFLEAQNPASLIAPLRRWSEGAPAPSWSKAAIRSISTEPGSQNTQ